MESSTYIQAGELALTRNIPKELDQLAGLQHQNKQLKNALIILGLLAGTCILIAIIVATNDEKKD